MIAETSKGLDYGIVSTCMKMVDEELVQQPLRALVRKTTPEDEERIEALKGKEKEALKVCREKVREHELDMKMVNAEYSFDGTKVLFYFTADGRVDFRSLVKDLAGIFHVRIEPAPDWRERRDQDAGRHRHLRKRAVLRDVPSGVSAGFHQDGKGAESVPESDKDIRHLRETDVLPEK